MVAKERPNLVVMDIRMGATSGLDTLRKLRELDPKLLVIMMTAYGTTQTAIEAMKFGRVRLRAQAAGSAEAQGAHRVGAQGGARHARGGQLSAAAGQRRLCRGHRRQERADAAGVQAHRPGLAIGGDRADHRRKRHGQGTGGAGHLPSQPPRRETVHGDQLRRDSREPAGERIVRPRERRVYRRGRPADRQIRAVRPGDDFPR